MTSLSHSYRKFKVEIQTQSTSCWSTCSVHLSLFYFHAYAVKDWWQMWGTPPAILYLRLLREMNAWERAETIHISTPRVLTLLSLKRPEVRQWNKFRSLLFFFGFDFLPPILGLGYPQGLAFSSWKATRSLDVMLLMQCVILYKISEVLNHSKLQKGSPRGKVLTSEKGYFEAEEFSQNFLNPTMEVISWVNTTDSVLRQYIKHLFSTLENPPNLVSVCSSPECILSIT